jgi:hypothetical protein
MSAAFPNINEDTKEARPNRALIRPISKKEAPREAANIGTNTLDIVCEVFVRS